MIREMECFGWDRLLEVYCHDRLRCHTIFHIRTFFFFFFRERENWTIRWLCVLLVCLVICVVSMDRVLSSA